jgi:hypothetical protein
MGHPVVIAGGTNQSLWPEIFIEVVKTSDQVDNHGTDSWLVTANNPSETSLSITLVPGFPVALPNFPISEKGVEVHLPARSITTVARS